MKLSIIIVNYNVKYFLLQLLESIYDSQTGYGFEVIIVDNASTDGSPKLITERYPRVTFIANKENVGFSKANNQAIEVAQGDLVLLLNPDTILQENTLQETISFMDRYPEAGAVGCRMIDGSGHYLPESKRGFPSPLVAFFKAFGLAALFPKSKFFNAYYLGHLPEWETNEIEVLTGAFMMIKKAVLDEVGYLDERFFMYGEDIDLSYRIIQANHKIFYHPVTTIIHFKGESTKKDTLAYIRTFYGAMKGFAHKHYSGQKASLLSITLNLAIYFRAALAAVKTILQRFGLAVIDFGVIAIFLWVFSMFWADFYYDDPNYYRHSMLKTNISIFAATYVICLYLMGAYDRILAWMRALRSVLVAWVLIAALYGLLGQDMRPSRALVIAAGFLAFIAIMTVRLIIYRLRFGHWRILADAQNRYVIVGDPTVGAGVTKLVQANHPAYQFQGYIVMQEDTTGSNVIGHITQLDQICRFYKVHEIIFLSRDIDSSQIMQWMTRLGQQYAYKMAPDSSASIIGSRRKDLPGELYTFDIHYNVDDPFLRRNKRILDLLVSSILFIFSPLLWWLVDSPSGFLRNIWAVFHGQKTWVSYSSENSERRFPPLRPGVVTPAPALLPGADQGTMIRDADFYYARDYTPWKDIVIIFANFSKLGH